MTELIDFQENFLLKRLSPEISYFLGLIWADGYVGKYEISLELISTDFEQIWNVLQKIGFKTYHQRRRKNSKNSQSNVRIYSKIISERLAELGYSNKSTGNSMEAWNFIPEEFKKYYLRGFLDGDGSISVMKDNSVKVTFYGHKDADWKFLTSFFEKHQIDFSIERKIRNGGNYKGQSYSLINIGSKNSIKKFLNLIYCDQYDDIGMIRKFSKYKEVLNIIENDIKTIKPIRHNCCSECGFKWESTKRKNLCAICKQKSLKKNKINFVLNKFEKLDVEDRQHCINEIITNGYSYPTAVKYYNILKSGAA